LYRIFPRLFQGMVTLAPLLFLLYLAAAEALRPLVFIPSGPGARYTLSGTVVAVSDGTQFDIRTIDDRQVALQALRTTWAQAHAAGAAPREQRIARAVDSVALHWDAGRSRLTWIGGVLVLWREPRPKAWILERLLYAQSPGKSHLTLGEAHWVIRSASLKTGSFVSRVSDPNTRFLLKLESDMDIE